MLKNIIQTTALMFILVCSLSAQGNEDVLIIEAESFADSITLKWHSTNAAAWNKDLQAGYTVTRQEVNPDGSIQGSPQTLSANLKPQTKAWFITNGYRSNGLMDPIGALLYDPSFSFEDNDLLSEEEMKFNYVVYETTIDIEIAEAVGLAYRDFQTKPNTTYIYKVKGNGSGLENEVEIGTGTPRFIREPFEAYVNFQFPGGLSFSQMQNNTTENKFEAILAIARAYGDSVVLRWGPSSAGLWHSAMKDGYTIVRNDGSDVFEEIAHSFSLGKEST